MHKKKVVPGKLTKAAPVAKKNKPDGDAPVPKKGKGKSAGRY
jgi:hypothetical protein